ncbi:MAG: hypothetical protein CR968_01860 [Flavobacteriia bacterium]|nr:MAG: hypothetical protein CR968_01860 [Flavobacteriia bacterium]
MFKKLLLIIVVLALNSCHSKAQINPVKADTNVSTTAQSKAIKVGAENYDLYLPLLKNKRIGVVANQSSVVNDNYGGYTHLIDTLLAQNINIIKVFSPEHGFRGTADAGESVKNGMDTKTGLPLISLYGSNKKPKAKYLEDVDLVLFDLQDVGVRFYTYISTLHYVMEACAQQDIPVVVLDRPNPNISYIDGPVLEPSYKSFVGMHPVPVVYGMSIGEYARMINGEHWLAGGITCQLRTIPIEHYTRQTAYTIPVKPSPNLPNAQAVNLYPSLCFFEGTSISCGRGTNTPFQIFGSPELPETIYTFTFKPQPNTGAKKPKYKDKTCYGLDLTQATKLNQINLTWLSEAYQNYPDKTAFFNSYFNTLAGTGTLQEQIKLGYSEEDIRKTWQPGLDSFKKIREKYLLYP